MKAGNKGVTGVLTRPRGAGRLALRMARALLVAALLLSVAGLVVWWLGLLDRYFVFFPGKVVQGSPADLLLPYEDVHFTAGDGVRLHGWYISGGSGPGESATTLLWFNGNAGNIGHRVEKLGAMRRSLGVGQLIFDYRGYGASEGSPSEKGLYLDGEAALAYLKGRGDVDPTKIVFFGESLGSAVAVRLAANRGAYGVVLQAPFTSIKAMAQRAFPVLPLWLSVRSRFDSLAMVGRVRAPLLVMHSDADEIVPFEMGRRLHEAANEPKRLFVIQGALHNDPHLAPDSPYFQALRDFLASLER